MKILLAAAIVTGFTSLAGEHAVIESLQGTHLEGELSIISNRFCLVNTNSFTTNLIDSKSVRSLRVPSVRVTNDVPEGILLANGSILAGKIQRVDDTAVTLTTFGKERTVSRVNVAQVFLQPAADAKLHSARAGLLPRNHDFVDGELVGIKDGKIKMTSVLFGSKTYSARDVSQIVLREHHRSSSCQFEVRTRDLSRLCTDNILVASNAIIVGGVLSSNLTIPLNDIARIKRN